MGVARDDKAVLSITEGEVEQARALKARVDQVRAAADANATESMTVTLRGDDYEVEVPPELATVIAKVVDLLGRGSTVTVGSIPNEVTTTVAARMLNISRPTLMKMVADGDLPAHKVGSHTRLFSKDVLAHRESRRATQREAFDSLRELEDELGLTD